MAWFVEQSSMLEVMSKIASDPTARAAYHANPEAFLRTTDLDKTERALMLCKDEAAVIRALLTRADDSET